MSPLIIACERGKSPELSDHQIQTLLGSSFGISEDAQRIAQKALTSLEEPRSRAILTGISTCGDLRSSVGSLPVRPMESY